MTSAAPSATRCSSPPESESVVRSSSGSIASASAASSTALAVSTEPRAPQLQRQLELGPDRRRDDLGLRLLGHEPDRGRQARRGRSSGVERPPIRISPGDLATVEVRDEPARGAQQRALAGARSAGEDDELTTVEPQVDAGQGQSREIPDSGTRAVRSPGPAQPRRDLRRLRIAAGRNGASAIARQGRRRAAASAGPVSIETSRIGVEARRRPAAAAPSSASSQQPGGQQRRPRRARGRAGAAASGSRARSRAARASRRCRPSGRASRRSVAGRSRRGRAEPRRDRAGGPPPPRLRSRTRCSRATRASTGIRPRSAPGGSASGSRTTSTGRSRATATGARRCRCGSAIAIRSHVDVDRQLRRARRARGAGRCRDDFDPHKPFIDTYTWRCAMRRARCVARPR